MIGSYLILFFFFFQAEDGIRDIGVTGVQTCALPICTSNDEVIDLLQGGQGVFGIAIGGVWREIEGTLAELPSERTADERSEERRVGKECRSRWSPYH